MCFQEANCYKCEYYVHPDNASEEEPVCDVEERIALALEEEFPYEWLDENIHISKYYCRKRLGKEPKPQKGDVKYE